MAYKHMGASTVKRVMKYPHRARCSYSGNTGTVYSSYEKVTEPWQQDKINDVFTSRYCTCERCVDAREHKKRVKEALEAIGATESLKAMGWQ